MATLTFVEPTWERMIRAVERVKERLQRAVTALEAANIPYAVIGGNAVANWVIRVDPGAERFTKDVDLLVRRLDLEAIIQAMTAAGFTYSFVWGVHAFADAESNTISDGVHLLFENEKVKPDAITSAPALDESEATISFRVINLEALVRMKLESNRDKDRTHVRDMIGVGLIDDLWLSKFPPVLAERLKSMLDTPDG
jgi:hypothetical protein